MRPSLIARTTAAVTAIGFAAALAGCVSLFPKAEPAQLYRFQPDMAEPAPGPIEGRVPISMSPIEFTRAAAGDHFLTIDGDAAAYIEGARWVVPAQDMFEEAITRAFARGATATRLVERRQSASAQLVLNVTVETFETRYVAGPKAAPTVVVGLRAQLIRYPERAVIASHTFHAEQAAADNRVSAIVPAYEATVTSVLKELTAWTDEEASKARG